jgi:acyl carrier protein
MINKVINAIKASQPEAAGITITRDTRFYDIPGMDSMSVVTFQMHLKETIGQKAETVQPIMDMTVSEYAEILASL